MSGRTVWDGVRHRLLAVLAPLLRVRPRLAAWTLESIRHVPFAPARARLYREFSWPLACDLDMQLVARVPGGRMTCDTGDLVGRVVAVSGIWEPSATAIVRDLLAPGDVVVDIGAHVGCFSLLASGAVGPAGRVFALEPSPARHRELQRNLALNGVTNVVAGDAVVPSGLHRRVRLVTIDVEGYEAEALRGVQGMLASAARAVVLVELSPAWSEEGPAEVERLCATYGLEPWLVANDCTVSGLFPSRLRPLQRLATIPRRRCDLLLTRPRDSAVLADRLGVAA